MTIGEVIAMLMEIFNYLSQYLGDLFGKKEEEGEDAETPVA